VNLIPTLPTVGVAETDHEGQYEFNEIPATGRYRVVGVKPVEGAEPILVVGLTEKLRAGQILKFDLSANLPWTRDATP